MYNFGVPGDLVAPGTTVWRNPQNYALTTPYAQTLTASTTIVCFGHYPGLAIQPAVSGEIVINKAGDLEILRNGLAASWNVIFKGTTLGAVPIADGSFGCLVVRRDAGNNVTVYDSSAIRTFLPLTPALGPANVPGAWSSNPLVLGDPTTSLHGILSELRVYNRALTDVELIHEMSITRRDLAHRGIALP